MKPPWSIAFWYQLVLEPKPATKKGIIASYEGITVFLTVDDHVIGINDGETDYLGPTITGLKNAPWILCGLDNAESNITLYLNGEKAIKIAQGEIVYKIQQFHVEASKKSQPPFIEADLSDWVTKRESMFKIKQETSEQYRLLTSQEQEKQLIERMDALEDLLRAYHSGKYYFLEDILANLRSLVFYKDKSTYDPLLFRVAAFKHSPLPVYVAPADDELTQVTSTQPTMAVSSSLSFEPVIPWVKNIDFQEFIEKPGILYEGQVVSPLELIEKISNTQSVAHFDQRVPIIVEGLKNTPVIFGHNFLESLIINLSEIVIKLGRFVLKL